MKSKKAPSVSPSDFSSWHRPGPMFSPAEARCVTFTVSGDKLHVQAPAETIRKIADRLTLLGALAEPPLPYGTWSEKTQGESR